MPGSALPGSAPPARTSPGAAIGAEAVTALVACAAVFEPGDPPRAGQVAFWVDPAAGGALPDVGTPGEVTVAVPDGQTVRRRSLPAVRLPVDAAVPVLVAARRHASAHPAARFWGAVTLVALDLVARGRMLPGVTAAGWDTWRIGPLDPTDTRRVHDLTAAMPPHARAVPLPGDGTLTLPAAWPLVRAFLDAVADTMPRTPAAVIAAGDPRYAATEPHHVPELRTWAQDLGAGGDAGVQVSLRLEISLEDLASGGAGEYCRAVVQVHHGTDPELVVDAAALWGAAADDERWGPQARVDTMLAVRRAARLWAPLEPLLDQPVPDSVPLDDDDLTDLLGEAGARLAAAGVAVHWPKELVRDLTAHVVVGGGQAPLSDVPRWFGGDSLLAFDWRLALGGRELSAEEMDRLAETHRPIVRLHDQWVVVDPELVRRSRQRKPLTAMEALGAALTGVVDAAGGPVPVVATGWLERLQAAIREPDEGTEPVTQPPALAATLRGYQLRGLRWLVRMSSLGLGCCLADDMGLGKTVTLIALHLHRQRDDRTAGPTLVVCPASLLGNWEREIRRFAPGEDVVRYHGAGRAIDGVTGGFVVTTYATMRRDSARLADHRWGLLVAATRRST